MTGRKVSTSSHAMVLAGWLLSISTLTIAMTVAMMKMISPI
jgi:hypothetical protein